MRTVFAREKAQAIGEKVCQSVLMINESVGGREAQRLVAGGGAVCGRQGREARGSVRVAEEG